MIEFKNIVKVFHNYNNNKVTALKGINLKLASTGLVFIAGPSGGGKSTLLNILSGVDVQTSGDMLVNGVNTKKLGAVGFDGYRNNFVGIVHQDLHMLDHLTLGQNVALAMELQGVKPDAEKITELFKKLGISGLENRHANQCSVGQCQRAAIARTLVKNPKILIADEPTSNIDPENRKEIYALLKEISKEVLVIAATHNNDMIDRYADRILRIKDGGIAEDSVTGGDNTNIEVFDKGNVVAIEPGTVLSSGDVEQLNNIIRANNKKGVFMCFEKSAAKVQQINPNAAQQMLRSTLRKKQKAKEKTKKEKLQRLEDLTDSGVFQFEKAKLPTKAAWRMSMVNFTSNKLRSIFTVVLSFLAIMFYALATSLAQVNQNSLIISTFAADSEPYITFGTNSKLFNSSNPFGDDVPDWTAGSSASDLYGNSGLVYDFGKSATTGAPTDAGGPSAGDPNPASRAHIYGVRKAIVPVCEGDTNKFGVQLEEGSWPTTSTDANNIVISDFVAVQLQTAYYLQAIASKIDSANYVPTFQQMVGLDTFVGRDLILIDGVEFKIIGIYKTDFRDFFVFDSVSGYLKVYPETSAFFQPDLIRLRPILSKNQKMRAEYLLQNDYVTAFVSPEFVNTEKNVYMLYGDAMEKSDYYITQHSKGAPEGMLYRSIERATKDFTFGGVALVNSQKLTEDISPGTIKISEQFYYDMMGGKPGDLEEGKIKSAISGSELKFEFSIAKRVYSYSVLPDWSESDTSTNALKSTQSGYYTLKTFAFTIDRELEDINGKNYSVLLNGADFKELMQAFYMPSTSFAVAGSYSTKTLQTIFNRMGGDVTPMYGNSAAISEYTGSFDSMSGAMTTASIALAIFVAALMYNYIFQSIRSKRKSIAVIRSMGARTGDIFKIFFLEAAVIAGLVILGSFISIIVACVVGNAIIGAAAGMSLAILVPDAVFMLIVLGTVLVLILASYMIPVYAYARHNSSKGLVRNINIKSDN